jgi:PilZ domain
MNVIKKWFEQWFSKDRRRAARQPLPGLVAHYWTGSVSVGKGVGDISSTGLYLLTEERWYPGTMIKITLQRTGKAGENTEDRTIIVHTKVVRSGPDGVGLAFVSPDAIELRAHNMQNFVADTKTLQKFLQGLKNT